MAYQPSSQGPWLRGLVASNQPLSQPKGSFPRGSNLLMIERGALTPCDGSGIINAFGGTVPLGNQGKFLSTFLFSPTGVTPYYLALQRVSVPLAAPFAVSATAIPGGSLTNGTTYYYVVTAIDGGGGETVASNEVSAMASGGNLTIAVKWNAVPNAFGYNIYRGTSPGSEIKLVASNLPVLQTGAANYTYNDTGVGSFTTFTSNFVSATAYTTGGQPYIQFNLAAGNTLPSGSLIGLPVTSSGFSPGTFNGSWTIFSVPNSSSFIVKGGPGSGSAGPVTTTLGPNTAGAGRQFGGFGSGTTIWANANANGVNGVGPAAACSLPPFTSPSQWLAASSFGFAGIPGGATITGIQAFISRNVSLHFQDEIADSGVQLLNASGNPTGTDHSSFSVWSLPAQTYGSTSDLWGAAWTPANIMNANFGVAIGVGSSSSDPGTPTPNVSLIQMSVTYTTSGTGGTIVIDNTTSGSQPPLVNNTAQTVLYKMPNTGSIPIPYTAANIVAYYPAAELALGVPPSGGSGGGGTTGPGTLSNATSSTPSGGIGGLVGPVPQFKQFTNRAIIALGNGFAPQVYWDSSGTTVNAAPTGSVTSVTQSGDQMTVTIPGGPISQNQPTLGSGATNPVFIPVGSSITLSGMSPAANNGTFTVLGVTGSTFTVRNPSGVAAGAVGTYTVQTTPITSNFVASYPVWTTGTVYVTGDIIIPASQPPNPIYLTCIQPGTSGGAEPGWTSPQPVIGQNFEDGKTVIWKVSGLLAASAVPPPGAAHIEIFAGSLWVLNTWFNNTTNGLDGPSALRMSNTNDIFAWNPVNQAFLDKDDGAEGMALGKFTITAQGIPPEGSLIAFKYRVPYQIIGVFGATNFAIQPVSSDMGCLAPRSVVFVPGFGLMRYTHLGIATFDGYRDTVNSEQIRPFLFPVNDFDTADIIVADANYLPLSWACQTANPPMYAFAMPIGNSGGKLTRIMSFDLILKCWAAPVDLPFPIGCMAQVQPITSNPLTIFGGFSDGCIQRWQAGDIQWYTGGGVAQQEVLWNFRTTTLASMQSSQRIWVRKVIIRGTGDNLDTDPFLNITVAIRRSAIVLSAITYQVSNVGDFEVFADVGYTGLRFDAIVSGADHLEIDGVDWAVEPRPFGVQVAAV